MGASTTTPHTANQTLLALAERPATWERLRERAPLDLYTVDNAIEEGLRWSTPTNHLMRRTTARVEIAGTEIAEGELVCAWVASANRDASVFKEPYVFDPWRSPNPHIAFGIGPHYCIGGPAARVALNVLLAQLLADFEGFEVTGEVTHLRSNFINGITRLPVRGVRAKAQVAASSVVRERADG
jgi:cytochrome P450